LAKAPLLKPPDWRKPFHVYCDALAMAIEVALYQVVEDTSRAHLIAFTSHQLTLAKRNYTTIKRECLAMIFSIKKIDIIFLLL